MGLSQKATGFESVRGIIVKREGQISRGPRGRDGRAGGSKTEVLQDLLHHLLGDEGENHAPAAAGTREHVFAKDAQEKLGPGDAGGLTARRGLRWRRWGIRGTRPGPFLLRPRHDLAPPG